jgi:cytochrome c biogenesis protein CcmG, thiol:disulfide interchange protein DsbE
LLSTPSSDTPDRPPRRGRALLVAVGALALVTGATVWAVSAGGGNVGNGATSEASAGGVRCRTTVANNAGDALVGHAAPLFTLPSLDGRCIDLSKYRGRPVVMNFWASWCHPCRQEFPLLRAARARHAADGLVMIGVVHQDIADDARQFANEEHATWPMLFDGNNTVSAEYGVKPIPQTFFIRRDGTIAARVFGLSSRRQLEHELTRIING